MIELWKYGRKYVKLSIEEDSVCRVLGGKTVYAWKSLNRGLVVINMRAAAVKDGLCLMKWYTV